MAYAVIMAGGQGERFWPLTHEKFPKYRLKFEGKNSLLQKTYSRLRKLYAENEIFIVTTSEHRPMIHEELPTLSSKQLLIEPYRNNTASAILFSTAWIANKFGNEAIVSFFPADHLIQNERLFCQTLVQAIAVARRHPYLVTLGIKPSFPSQAYGYIEATEKMPGEKQIYFVKRFVEKPKLKAAKQFIKSKNFYWNGGIFTWETGVFLDHMHRYAPEFTKKFNLRFLEASYKVLPNLSIDYALLERVEKMALVPALMDWCDIGSWDRLYDKLPKNKAGNFTEGAVILDRVKGSLILNHTRERLVLVGISNVIVAQTPQGTVICPRGSSDHAALLSKKFS